ncbi:FAD binding domain-containing protein [Ramlibacter tataouinensis]|uniref:FAD binding domain-containing protein n=1 Tax=Ramlibacter tataouinensis TaxID=94132 RepID=UPI0022F3BA66|nr:FAD binding domain-containing protein [Ramlibacter tataouinensis]WBY00245.1 FAD binding domain-containing protein [Ramlibacter tataouinensis]
MVDFDYARPRTLAEALALLAANPEARALAGGQTLIPTLKQRLARPALLVDLQAIAELRGIEVGDGFVSVGAMTRHAETASHAGLSAAIPALAFLAGGIAHPQVRHVGTMGGSISNNDPAADYPGALLGLGAQVQTTSRSIAADDFFTGLFSTALEPGELVVRVRFPRPVRAGYCKIANPASGYVTTGCFIADFGGGRVRVAVNGAGPCVFRLPALEAALGADFSPAALAGFRQDPKGLNADLHASAAYRAQLVAVAVRRALSMALSASPLLESSPA